MEHISLDVFGYTNKKVASLYDSMVSSPGSAHDIKIEWNLTGDRKLSFSLPYMIGDVSNWRWNHVAAQYRVRVLIDDYEDWFIITNPKKQKASKKISQQITCDHLSSILKTKNLYLYFDEENGIGDVPYLMNQIMAGTGWTFDEDGSDVFYENYGDAAGTQIKKRSLESDTKAGCYSLIASVCDLFNAYPIFNAANKTVQLHDLNNKQPLKEMIIGINLSAVTVDYNSQNVITRLYVEGDYDEDEYVSIDSVNPTGLSYLLCFDYYKQIGLFTEQHELALNTYYTDIKAAKQQTSSDVTSLTQKSAMLNSLWGTQNYILWPVQNEKLGDKIVGGLAEVDEAKQELDVGDKMYVFWHDDTLTSNKDRYKVVDVTIDTVYEFNKENYEFIGDNGVVTHVMKWITGCSGSIGAKETSIQAKQKVIDECKEQNQKQTTTDKKKQQNLDTIAANEAAIQEIYLGNSAAESQSFEYTCKVVGQHKMSNGDTLDCQLKRTSTNSVLSTTTYYVSQNTAQITTDETVITYSPTTRLFFGDYGNTDMLANDETNHKVESVIRNIDEKILNCSTAAVDFELKVVDGSQLGNVIQLTGTTFTINVKAKPYNLYQQYAKAVQLAVQVAQLKDDYDADIKNQEQIQADFLLAMGDMLKDGYWADDNYIAGQEQFLYNDALDVMKQVSKPKVTYSVTLSNFEQAMDQAAQLNTKVRIYDKELNINDTVYVSKIVKYLDRTDKAQVEISNEQVSVSSSFDSIFSRISDISKLVEQKKTIFERAKNLTSSGTLATNRLEGAINIMSTQLGSSVSSWYTDDSGNIMFEAADGTGAMKLCGDGLMIADGKTSSGNWNWRTCSTGKGITADAIYAGYLSADRIESESITVNKLASDVGTSLNLSSNSSVKTVVTDYVDSTSEYIVNITSDNGLFFVDDIKTINLTATIMYQGSDVTASNESSLCWYVDDVLKTTGTKTITINAGDVDESISIKCALTKSVPDEDDRTYYNTVSITKVAQKNRIEMYLNSNHSTSQIYDPNGIGTFSPDWTTDHLVIAPNIYVDNNQKTPGSDSSLSVVWSKKIDGVEYSLDSTYETVNASTAVLTVSKNSMDENNVNSISYVCKATYGTSVNVSSISYTFVAGVADPKFCNITGQNVFRYTDGVANPNTVTITAQVSNATLTGWQYKKKNADGTYTWTSIPSAGTNKTIVIQSADSLGLFNDETLCTVKAVTSDASVYDVFSIYKVSDGENGIDGHDYYTHIRYSASADGTDMKENPDSTTVYIGVYAGLSQEVPPKESFKWSRYVGTDGQNITVKSTVTEYNQSAQKGRPADDDPGWSTTAPTIQQGTFIWTRVTTTFSNDQVNKTYNVSYNGNNGTDGVTYYTYIRYSKNADGTDMKVNPQADTQYIGIHVGTQTSAPVNKTAYTWSKIKGEDGESVTIEKTEMKYAKTDTDTQPPIDSSLWQDTIPQIEQGSYIWTWAAVDYSDGTHTNQFNVAYSGTDGQNTSTMFLTNEAISFPANYEGKCESMTVKTNVVAYNGTTKVAPTINTTGIKYMKDGVQSGKPQGMTITVGAFDNDKTSDTYLQVTITMTIAENATLGSDGSTYGQIIIPVSVINNGVNISTNLHWSWSKINKGKDGQNAVVLTTYTPNGNVFNLATDVLTINASAYDGSTDISSTASFVWYKYDNGWVQFDHKDDPIGHSSITVVQSDVLGSCLFKCVMTYNTLTYIYITTLTDKQDEYQAVLTSSEGVNIGQTVTSTDILCSIYRKGQKVTSTDVTYIWSKIDKDGTSSVISGNTNTITVDTSTLTSQTTFVCHASVGTASSIVITKVNSTVIISDVEPQNPSIDDLWLDTSQAQHVLMVYKGGQDEWVKALPSGSDISDTVTRQVAQTYVTKTAIGAYVKTQTLKSAVGQLNESIASMKLTDSDFQVMFNKTVADGIKENIDDAVEQYANSVSTYMRYDKKDGVLKLGSQGDGKENFVAQLSQEKLAFKYVGDGQNKQVAYIGKDDMYITNARVTKALYIGYSDLGYFSWTVTQTGLGLKWVGTQT